YGAGRGDLLRQREHHTQREEVTTNLGTENPEPNRDLIMHPSRSRGRLVLFGGLTLAGIVALIWAFGTGRPTGLPIPYAAGTVEAADAKPGPSDHTMFGGTNDRNMVNFKDKNIPDKFDAETDAIWKADLGSKAYGGPIVAGGRVYVGTNNPRPPHLRDNKKTPDRDVEPLGKGVLMVFGEKDGKFLWQAIHDKLAGAGRVHDWPDEGICSTPTVEGDRVYYVTNRCTVVCSDVEGMANGNQGFTGEKYKDPTDVDIIWEYDMMKELNVFPHNMSACCPLIVGDIMYIVTANGVDEGHLNIPQPLAPSFIAMDKKTGKLLWKSNAPGKNILHGQWSNPVYGEINGVRQVIFPG